MRGGPKSVLRRQPETDPDPRRRRLTLCAWIHPPAKTLFSSLHLAYRWSTCSPGGSSTNVDDDTISFPPLSPMASEPSFRLRHVPRPHHDVQCGAPRPVSSAAAADLIGTSGPMNVATCCEAWVLPKLDAD